MKHLLPIQICKGKSEPNDKKKTMNPKHQDGSFYLRVYSISLDKLQNSAWNLTAH